MVSDGVVESVEGDTIRIDVDSVCLHGDSPAAVAMAVATRELLTAEGIEITPFA